VIEQNGRIHNQVAELLSAYIDGEVVADERARVEAHLAACAACAHDLATLRQTVALLGQLPQVAAPRPFTLRESDVSAVRPARTAWWRLPWAQGVVAAAAVLLCVVAVGSVLLMGRPWLGGAPAAPQPMALQEAPRAAEEAVVETVVVEKEGAVEKGVEREIEEAAPGAAAEIPVAEEAPSEPALAQEAPAPAAAEAEREAIADTAVPPTAPSAVATPTPGVESTPVVGQSDANATEERETDQVPLGTPAPTIEALAVPLPLLEVQDLVLKIEPGIIYVGGRLPLPEGQQLQAELWREGHLTDWEMAEAKQVTSGADGQFSLRLQAQPGAPDFDLFAIEPASYEIRVHPVAPSELWEARIPFDTYAPPAESSEPLGHAGQTATRLIRLAVSAPISVALLEGAASPATTAPIVPRTSVFLAGLCGFGLVGGLAVIFTLRTWR